MLALLGDAEAAGAMLVQRSPVVGCTVRDEGFRVSIGGEGAIDLDCRFLVNAAGLYAQEVAHAIKGLKNCHVPARHLAKGNYFTLATRAPFAHLIYPVPEDGGLGVHLTLDMGGRGRFGPDVEWIDAIDYAVDPARAEDFYAAIRRYWPGLPDGALEAGYAGIRPKLREADFMIQGSDVHGLPGLINLFGIESPGLTACLAIAQHVVRKLG
jgi:L-2-hydroxyglutarate oxidase LhgO